MNPVAKRRFLRLVVSNYRSGGPLAEFVNRHRWRRALHRLLDVSREVETREREDAERRRIPQLEA
jgi:hypothetical protein